MSSSYEKSVRGGTKVKIAAPKSKYVEHILTATQAGEAGVAEVFRTLVHRLRDSTWTVAFKSLIIVHLMIKEGAPDVTLRYLSESPKNRLAINTFTDVQTQGHNIRRYASYLVCRATAFGATKYDYARGRDERLKRMSVEKGLLRETELVQAQIRELLNCELLSQEADNEISLTAFRLLTGDLLDLFHVENEAVMNVLSHYFEMSRPDAERAIKIYRKFCTQTGLVVQYLSVARQYEHVTHMEVPRIKHAPTSLAKSLQDYLDDKDFEINRRQYLAEQEAKRTGKPVQKPLASEKAPETSVQEVTRSTANTTAFDSTTKGPAPELIDFFESIEHNQQTMGQVPQPFPQVQGNAFIQQQQTGFQGPQPTGFPQNGFAAPAPNPFYQVQQQQQAQLPQPLQTQFTGAGFGGFGPQPQQPQLVSGGTFPPQQVQSLFDSNQQTQTPLHALGAQQTGPQASNPFRQSIMPMPTGDASGAFAPPQRQNTNPFARSTATPPIPPVPTIPENAFSPTPPPQQPQLLQSQPTGTNPFARAPQPQASQTVPPPPAQGVLQVQPTGSTNPFRQSAFVNQTFQTGWQNVPQGTMGGFESLETIPIFPRPGQSAPQQQQPWS